jgi:hypothetical protein
MFHAMGRFPEERIRCVNLWRLKVASSSQVNMATWERDQVLGACLASEPCRGFAATCGSNKFNKTLVD